MVSWIFVIQCFYRVIDRTVNARRESQREFFRNVFCPMSTRRRNVGLGHAIRIGFNEVRNISEKIRGLKAEMQKKEKSDKRPSFQERRLSAAWHETSSLKF